MICRKYNIKIEYYNQSNQELDNEEYEEKKDEEEEESEEEESLDDIVFD